MYLEESYDIGAAIAFDEGSKRLYRLISEDIERLVLMPKGSCIWDLNTTSLLRILPKQFRPYYDYCFLIHLRSVLYDMRKTVRTGEQLIAHTVLQELILYLSAQEAKKSSEALEACGGESEELIYALLDDLDVVTFLFSDIILDPDDAYHYVHWDEQQFNMGLE